MNRNETDMPTDADHPTNCACALCFSEGRNAFHRDHLADMPLRTILSDIDAAHTPDRSACYDTTLDPISPNFSMARFLGTD